MFAASSTKNAMDEVAALYGAETGHQVTVSYAGSSVLARQIQQGAPADIFVSANTAWMDVLEIDNHIDTTSRFDLLGNSLVLVAPLSNTLNVDLTQSETLVDMLGDGWIAMALVDAVPAGIYGKSALRSLGIWDDVAQNVAQTDNARTALSLVSIGEVAMGIVYATDAKADENVSVIATFPSRTHLPILYPVAGVGAATPTKVHFLTFLKSNLARQIFERHGFIVLGG